MGICFFSVAMVVDGFFVVSSNAHNFKQNNKIMMLQCLRQSSRRLHRISRFHDGPKNGVQKEQEFIGGLPVEEDTPVLSRTKVNEMYQHYNVSKFRHEIEITMPDLGDTGNGTLLQWYKEPGDFVEQDALLCEIETDAFTFQMQTDDEELGLLKEICVPAGTREIVKGQLLAKILLLDEDTQELKR